ncbi:MAG: hypothetical protein ACLGHZ_09675 [Actinomycetes bacterium]
MDESTPFSNRPPDPFVAARIDDPSAPPPRTFTLAGLLGDSDRPGRRRLYLNTRLDFWAEFLTDDVRAVEPVAPDQPPFMGLDATRVTLARDARVDYVRTQSLEEDAFALQPRASDVVPLPAQTWEAECPGPTWGGCPTELCGTNIECPSGWTVCKPATCRFTENATCDTCRTCGDATCDTCRGTTCVTCGNVTCRTCRTCVRTCGPTCANTCAPTCANTCANTCARTCGPTCRATCVPELCETLVLCPTQLQTHCFTCRCRTDFC